MTAAWDVFHSVKLEVDRGVSTEVVRARLLAGDLNGDDLIRPAGTTRWSRISQVAAFNAPEPPVELPPPPPAEARVTAPPRAPLPPPVPVAPPQVQAPPPPPAPVSPPPVAPPPPVEPLRLRPQVDLGPEPEPPPPLVPLAGLEFPDDAGDDEDSVEAEPVSLADSFPPLDDDDDEEAFEPPVLPDDEAGGPQPPELGDPLAPELEAAAAVEDDAASDFTLSRNSTERVEELDLAAMVDVAFQLVLFFLVTASTIVFKTLEVPRPNEDKPPDAAVQSRAKTIDELEKDYILVEVAADGAVKVDHLPVSADRTALVEKLRQARESTGRKAMLLSADFNARHRNAVLAFDVASEIDLQIAIAQPTGKN